MWWNKSPPLTNSITKKSLSVDWNAEKRAVMKRHWRPRARTSLSSKLVSAVSSFKMSFLFTILIAHICLVLFLSARITCKQGNFWFLTCSATYLCTFPNPPRPNIVFSVKSSILRAFFPLPLYIDRVLIRCSSFFCKANITAANLVLSTPQGKLPAF